MSRLKALLLVVVALLILGVAVGSALYLMRPAVPATSTSLPPTSVSATQATTLTTSKPTTSIATSVTTKPASTTIPPAGSAQPRITDVVPEGFMLVDKEVYWRIKIYGEVDLRNYTTINGVYGSWFGRIDVTLPDGRESRLYEPPDYVNIVTQFSYLWGVKVLDVYVPTSWYENPCLEGEYRVKIWLQGPYENRTTLFDKVFTYRMNLKAAISPTVWTSLNESLKLTIANTGEVPLILMGVGIERNGTVVGWVLVPPEEIIMPGKSKELVASAQIRDDFREEFKGRTVVVDFVLDIVAAPRRYAVTTEVRFPAK